MIKALLDYDFCYNRWGNIWNWGNVFSCANLCHTKGIYSRMDDEKKCVEQK